MYKHIVFDLDGTLADTLEDLADAVNYALKNSGFAIYKIEEYRFFVGSGADNLIRKVLKENANDEKIVAKVMQDFSFYYNSHSIDKTKAYPGMEDVLINLQESGIKISVLSNKPHAYVGAILNKIFPKVSFSAAWGKKEDFKVKPNPEALNALIDETDTLKQDVLYVGDSDVDVKTALNAGVDFAGVEWGFRGREELINAGATHTFAKSNLLENFILSWK